MSTVNRDKKNILYLLLFTYKKSYCLVALNILKNYCKSKTSFTSEQYTKFLLCLLFLNNLVFFLYWLLDVYTLHITLSDNATILQQSTTSPCTNKLQIKNKFYFCNKKPIKLPTCFYNNMNNITFYSLGML